MKKRFNAIAAAVLALGMVVGMCGCEGSCRSRKPRNVRMRRI